MSHEIRTPLNGIIGMTELALGTDLTPRQREYIESAAQSADSLLLIVNDVLDFSKIEAGKFQLDATEFAIRKSLDETVQALAPTAHAKGLELNYQILADVPDGLYGDAVRLRQIVNNLLSNAIKFTEEGEVELKVSVDQCDGDTVYLHFSVRDTGIGIPADKRAQIFEAFSQVDASTTRKYGGTGLGLTICSYLVHEMQGRIRVDSQPGKGSVFHCSLPFGICPSASSQAAATASRNLQGLAVLVVEDNETNRQILSETLANWDMHPTVVPDGQAALTAMDEATQRGRGFDVVLMDCQMPGMDGFEIVAQLQQRPELARIPVVMLSSGGATDLARCQQLGVSGSLLKPIRQSKLLDAICQAVKRTTAEAKPSTGVAEEELPQVPRQLRVLLAEDGLVNQKLAVGLLEKQGHQVVVASDGKSAIEALDSDDFDLVLMDVRMPHIDGLDATRRIRKKEKGSGVHLPIVAMTAHAMEGDREKCLEAGMDDYISKPIRAKLFFETIAKVVAQADAEEMAPPPPNIADLHAALAVCNGDRQLLRDLVEIAATECPRRLTAIGEAIADSDAKELQLNAHTLKSCLHHLAAQQAARLAGRLELCGSSKDLSDAPQLYRELAPQMDKLQAELSEYLEQSEGQAAD